MSAQCKLPSTESQDMRKLFLQEDQYALQDVEMDLEQELKSVMILMLWDQMDEVVFAPLKVDGYVLGERQQQLILVHNEQPDFILIQPRLCEKHTVEMD